MRDRGGKSFSTQGATVLATQEGVDPQDTDTDTKQAVLWELLSPKNTPAEMEVMTK